MDAAKKLRSSIMKCIWGTSSKNRCVEVVMGILHDPTRVDHTFAAVAKAVSDARRMLRKDEPRYQQALEIFTNYDEEDAKIPGPVHGLIETVSLARGQMYLKNDGELHLKTPLGADVALRTAHGTHLKEVIKEACRYSAIQHLCDRIGDDKSEDGNRQDMQGIEPYVDNSATMALCRAKDKHDIEADMEEPMPCLSEETDECRTRIPAISRAVGIGPRRRRKLHTIILGSIRPPHRLIHTGVIESDICDNPKCKGARCDTKHYLLGLP